MYKNPNCELKWICDIDKKKLSKLGLELRKVKQTQNAQSILTDPDIDLVCIASYDEYHYEQIIEALDNNKHVYVEKPMCLTLTQAKNIRLKLNNLPHLHLSSNMVLRTCPLFKKVRNAVKSKKIGEVYLIEADYLWGRLNKLIKGWRAEAEFFSVILGAAVHMVDLVIWITGKKPDTIQALGSDIITSGSAQRHNDFAILVLKFKDKLIAKITAHGGCVHPHFHQLKLFGSKSTFLHDIIGTKWIDSSEPNQTPIIETAEYPAKNQRNEALTSFVNLLLNKNKKVLVTKQDVFNVMSICLAAEESIMSGKKISIDYL